MGTYIHNIAQSMIGQLGITEADLHANRGDDGLPSFGNEQWDEHDHSVSRRPQYLHHNCWEKMTPLLERMRVETLGKIAACGIDIFEARKLGKTSLEEVGHDHVLSLENPGRYVLAQLARTAIVAEMYDILSGGWVPEL